MSTQAIVKAFDEFKDDTTCLLLGLKNGARSAFALECAKEALHHRMVGTGARTAQADLDALGSQELLIAVAGLFAAPIRVMQQLGTDLAASPGRLQAWREEPLTRVP